MELRGYVAVFRARWLAIVLFTVIGAAVAFAWTLFQPRLYTADSSGFISTGTNTNLTDASIGDTYARSRAASYLNVATSRAVAEDVITELGLDTSPAALVRRISVSNPANSVIIKVSAEGDSPESASELANAWMQGIARQVADLENAGSDGQAGESIVSLTPIDSAVLPTSPSSPNVRLAVMVGALVGLAIGVLYAVVRHLFDRRVRSVDAIEGEVGVPVIGAIPVSRTLAARDRPDTVRSDVLGGDPAVSEAFRRLRTNLRYMNVDDPPRVILVTSPLPGDGKSTVTASLAAVMAAAGQTVFVVDGDLRRPTVTKAFGLPDDAGLTDVLVGGTTADNVLHTVDEDRRLHVLTAGGIPPNPTELLGSQTMHRLLVNLAKEGTVLIDAPPMLPVADGAVLAANTDGALMVASTGRVTYEQLARAIGHLERVNARPLGVIVNRVSLRGPDRSEYYQYRYEPTGAGS